MLPIITDPSSLRMVSTAVDLKLFDYKKIEGLIASFPTDAAGLSAPQIGIFERFFIARLAVGTYIFINPSLSCHSPDLFPSTEGCLSLPDIKCCIERHYRVKISADQIRTIAGPIDLQEMTLKSVDAAIVQHEFDHLEGKLITDYPTVKNTSEKAADKQRHRLYRVKSRRNERKTTTKTTARDVPTNPKKIAKMKQAEKQELRRFKRRVKEQERQRIEQEIFVSTNETEHELNDQG